MKDAECLMTNCRTGVAKPARQHGVRIAVAHTPRVGRFGNDDPANKSHAVRRTHPTYVAWLALLLSFVIRHTASGHPADQSELRAKPQPHQLELRFTFNILTLTRFAKIDADGDAKISIAELDEAQPVLMNYLNQHIPIEINQQKAALGKKARFEYLWPNVATTPPMPEFEYAARNVDVTFVLPVEDRLLEDFWIGFEFFEQTGPMQTIRGVYEQDGVITEVPFSVQEPEYTYDTGFADDPFVQEAEKKKIEPPPSEKRIWMIRVAILIAVIVLGCIAAISSRAAKRPTRRQRRS
jgi:hypothetical protein